MLTEFPQGADPSSLSKDPFGSTVFIDHATQAVFEVQPDWYPMALARANAERPDEAMAPPVLAVGAGERVHVFDATGRGWWNSRDDQSKAPWVERLQGGVGFDGRSTEANTIDPETKAITRVTRGPSDYDIYLVEPATGDNLGTRGHKFVGIDQRIEHDFGSDTLDLHADLALWSLTGGGVERPTIGGWE